MASLLKILILVSALTATSHALICIACDSVSSLECTGFNMTCPDGFLCGSVYVERTGGKKAVPVFSRFCLDPGTCGGKKSYPEYTIHYYCCDTDYCTPAIPACPIPGSKTVWFGTDIPVCDHGRKSTKKEL
ncbi:uncharacterized protein RB166_010587 [Leptodactylus fuscus]